MGRYGDVYNAKGTLEAAEADKFIALSSFPESVESTVPDTSYAEARE